MNDYRLCADCGKEFLDETIDSRRAVCTVCEAVATDTDQYRAWREQAERSRRWKRTRVTGERNGQRIAMNTRDADRHEIQQVSRDGREDDGEEAAELHR